MTTHKYPAVLPPQAQETIHDIISRLQHYLEQRETAYQELQRQNAQLSASLNTERQAHAATVLARSAADREVGVLTGERDELARQLSEARAALLAANARADAAERALGEALLGVSDDN